MEVESWSPIVRIPSTVVHIIAILATIFRLLYRWHLSRFLWEDTWATLALICDIGCLASVWMQTVPYIPDTVSQTNLKSNWLLSLTITSVLWFARMSILCSIVRIANPTLKLRRVAYCIGAMFLAMETGLLAQKIFICMENFCRFTNPVAIAQLVTDVISDIILVAVPVRFLRGVKLSRGRRILILAAFSASILITGITILHSVLLLQDTTNATLILGHVKAALSLLVCNALVLVTFVYRLCRKSGGGLEFSIPEDCGAGAGSNAVEFTSVIDLPSKLSSDGYPMSSGVHSRGDAACTKSLYQSQPKHEAVLGGAEVSCHYHVSEVRDASDEEVKAY